jgi:hypothetical protein
MAECECLAGCLFFNDKMKDMQGVSALYKRRYCLSDSSQCARHMVFERLGKPSVPADLYPNNIDRAISIMSGH